MTANEITAISQSIIRRDVGLTYSSETQWCVVYNDTGAVIASGLSFEHASAIGVSWNGAPKLLGAVAYHHADANELRVILQAAARRGLLTDAEQNRVAGRSGDQS